MPDAMTTGDARPALGGSTWKVVMAIGVASALLGLYLVVNLYSAVVVLAWVIGLSLVLHGLGDLLLDRYGNRTVSLAMGALAIATGIAALVWPDATLWAVAVVVGISFLVSGAVRCIVALTHRGPDNGWKWMLVDGGVSLVVGLAVVTWPDATVLVLGFLFGLRMIVVGAVAIVTALALRSV